MRSLSIFTAIFRPGRANWLSATAVSICLLTGGQAPAQSVKDEVDESYVEAVKGTSADWRGFDLVTRPYQDCLGKRWRGVCQGFKRRWSKGKDQNVHLGYLYDPVGSVLKVRMLLWNGDVFDGDTVCGVILWQDSEGRVVHSFNQRWGINGKGTGSARLRTKLYKYEVPRQAWREVRSVSFGERECKSGRNRKYTRFIHKILDKATAVCAAYSGQPTICAAAGEVAQEGLE